jgi:tetratricopeptide (TPR) repeat protein
MKKTILLLLAVLFVIGESRAQNRVIDSVKILLKKEKRDTARVTLLNKLNVEYYGTKTDSAMSYGLEALTLSQKIHYDKGAAISLNRIATVYTNTGNAPKAMELLLQALKINEKINNRDGIARNMANLGTVYNSMGDYHRTIGYEMRGAKIFEQLNDKIDLSKCFGAISIAYRALSKYDSAMVYAQKSYEGEKTFNKDKQGAALGLIGAVYFYTNEPDLALSYFRLSVSRFKQWGSVAGISNCYFGISKIYDKKGRADSALYYARKSFAISYSLNKYTSGIDNAGSYLGELFKKKGNTDSAYYYLTLAKAAKDSVTSQQRLNQFQNLEFDEKLRQIELANTEEKAAEERKHNLQFAGIAVAILTFLILFFALSRTIIVKENFIKYFNVVVLLAVFEFINLLIHPYLARFTHESPPLMLLILIGIGALLVPLHHKLEHWIAHVLTEKNKQIRLAAAKKTIANLEGDANL